jgi:outer membrane receptor protein involved in Fe transport
MDLIKEACMNRCQRILASAVMLLLAAMPLQAQSGTGLSGSVIDPSGAALPGVTVTLSGPGGSKQQVTGSDGRFAFSNLTPGTYTLTASVSGFGTVTQKDVAVGESATELPAISMKIAGLGETVVVTASKVESTVANAPATMSVITAETLETSPSQNFGDLLRSVPGTNVIQMSARDINLTSRQSTGTLTTSQLVLLDGRSIYLDFFGLVLWDLIPNNTAEIKQIEVVRGPASAVWGANALTGVVNIITKSPREAEGTSVSVTGGLFDRDGGSREDDGSGNGYGASLSFNRVINDRFAYKIAGGYYHSDPYSRPVGQIPVIPDPRVSSPVCTVTTGTTPLGIPGQIGTGPNCVGGGFYPVDGGGAPGTAFENNGTSQPKIDLRLDHELSRGRLTYSAGWGGSEGIVHTGIGPFDIQSGSYMAYGKVGYTRDALKVTVFGNFLDVEAPNLLLTDPGTGDPVALNFKTQTFDLEVGHSTVLGGNHILSYGGNARRNNFEITLTPEAEDRNEFGAYVQDEVHFGKFRLSLGGRVDKFGNIEDPVFSPRVTAMFKPTADHSFRASFNKAFRSPSAVNNFLEQNIFAPIAPINLAPLAGLIPTLVPGPQGQALASLVPTTPIRLIVRNVGNPNLKEESVTAYELAYTGTIAGRTSIGLAVYQNDSDDNINFSNITPSASFPAGIPPFDVYTPANSSECCAPVGIPGPLYAFLLQARIPGFPLPRTVTTYLNLGPLRQRGFEASLDHRFNNDFSASANYSFQARPTALTADADQIPYFPEEVAFAPRHRFNASEARNTARFLGSAGVNYSDKAFWSDVLSAPFHGFTDAYTMVNATFGVKWANGKVITSLKGTNLTNEKIQQHIFGDIIKRSIFAEVRATF